MEAPSLARSQKLQQHIWEWGGALTPGTSLRLEVTLLATCLKGQGPESESSSWLCLWSTWIEVLLMTIMFLRTQIGNFRLEAQWASSFGNAAFSRQEEALWWLLSQLPRYSSCGIYGDELKGQNLLFPCWPTLHHLFCYTGVVTLKGISRLLFIPLWLTISTVVRTVPMNVHRHT